VYSAATKPMMQCGVLGAESMGDSGEVSCRPMEPHQEAAQ